MEGDAVSEHLKTKNRTDFSSVRNLQFATCNLQLNPAYVAQLHGTKTETHGKGVVDLVHGALIQHAHFFF